MSEFKVFHGRSGPWGTTNIEALFDRSDCASMSVLGSAQVLTAEHSVTAIQIGAAFRTVFHLFRYNFAPIVPGPPETGVLGAMVRFHDDKQGTARLRPDCGATFVVSIGPADLVIETAHGNVTREVLRLPLTSVRALILETLFQPPDTAPATRLAPDMTAGKLLAAS